MLPHRLFSPIREEAKRLVWVVGASQPTSGTGGVS